MSDAIEENLVYQWAKSPMILNDDETRNTFLEKFRHEDFTVQYKILAYLFSNVTDAEHQPWMLKLANNIIPQPTESNFKSKRSMVDFFTLNFSSDNEIKELRYSIWSLIK